ncbi:MULTISPECIES: universal stress protein [Flavobacterium]|uniref:Universal stress protein n=2 Tax=Flavobacterium TaxID=237 RepID=A0A2N9PE95_9FLAO|nr:MULTISPECIES: universal stress protein [Flavobacterium]QYS88950.1 universal stress protein [Flavobacterium davisii]RVU90150.1 universal stress protein [Flavobacterium columnare]SPE78627.1 Universal stress protein family protein [Flavobacterium columnare]
MKTILVPTDFSDAANKASLFALKLAKKNQAKVLLLHSYNLPIIDVQSSVLSANMLYSSVDLDEFELFKENNKKLSELAYSKGLEDVEISHKIVLGELNVSINQCVKEELVDFIVMSTSGDDDWFSRVMGTNTDSVILTGNVPTLVLPDGCNTEDWETIGFTTRFKETDKEAFVNTIDLANKLGCTIKCLHVVNSADKVSDEIINSWKENFESDKVHFVFDTSENVMDGIENFIDNHQIHLLGMVTYKRDFFTELFTKRLTQKMTHRVHIPILVHHA